MFAVVGCFLLTKVVFGSEVFEEAVGAVLQHEVDVFGVVEEGVQFEDVGVGHEGLEFYLPEDLVDHVGLADLALVHDF